MFEHDELIRDGRCAMKFQVPHRLVRKRTLRTFIHYPHGAPSSAFAR